MGNLSQNMELGIRMRPLDWHSHVFSRSYGCGRSMHLFLTTAFVATFANLGFAADVPYVLDDFSDSIPHSMADGPSSTSATRTAMTMDDVGADPRVLLDRPGGQAVLLEEGGGAKYGGGAPILRVRITVFGDLGHPAKDGAEFKVAQEKARRYLFAVVVRSMMLTDTGGKQRDNVGVDLTAGEKPNVYTVTVPRFEEDWTEQMRGAAADQRSPLNRTHFFFEFAGLDLQSMTLLATNICNDYGRPQLELLSAVQRSLETVGLYPKQAIDIAARQESGLHSIIHLMVGIWEGPETVEGVGCFTEAQISQTSDYGILFMPACPEHAIRCDKDASPLLCEGVHAPLCVCKLGFSGKLEIPHLESLNTMDLGLRLHYTGECKLIPGYCDTGISDDFPLGLELQNGSEVTGTLGEDAQPICKPDFQPTGMSTCSGAGKDKGTWDPVRKCFYVRPQQPPRSRCKAESTGSTSTYDCAQCLPIQQNGFEEEPCNCKVQCNSGYKSVEHAEGFKKCREEEYVCPDKNNLEWRDSAAAWNRCVEKHTGSAVHDFCCDQAWGARRPEPLKQADCAKLNNDKDCLTSEQKAGLPSAGAPCCWTTDANDKETCGAKTAMTDSSNCAVRPFIAKAVWDPFPVCVKKCDNKFLQQQDSVDISGCDDCTPGENCGCKVECKEGTQRYGGGPTGYQICDNETGEFGRVPLCLRPDQIGVRNPTCTSFEETEALTVKGCGVLYGDCEANSPFGHNDVKCSEGYKRVGGGAESRRTCTQVKLVLPKAQCESLTNQDACLSHLHSTDQEVPCCWRNSTIGEGFAVAGAEDVVRCAAMGSDLIGVDGPPTACTETRGGKWDDDELPTCGRICSNDMQSKPELKVTDCDNCAVGDESCPCTVECADGYEFYGGGQGQRACKLFNETASSDQSVEPSLLPEPPICMKPPENPECVLPEKDGLELDSSCTGKECKMSCKDGTYLPIGTVRAGVKACQIVPNPNLQEAKCDDLTEPQKCLTSMQDGNPCCWNEDGLSDSLPNIRCMRKGDTRMGRAPEKCAPMVAAQWNEVPECRPVCSTEPLHAPHVLLEDCFRCAADQACPCTVQCAAGYERYGGGEEGNRNCTLDNPVMNKAPFCASKEETPTCSSKDLVPSVENTVRISGECNGVAAGGNRNCEVKCASGFQRTGGGTEGARNCKEQPAVLKPQLCEQITFREDCLQHKDEKTGFPCCWSSQMDPEWGFSCLSKADPRIGAHLQNGLWTAPHETCAAEREGVWHEQLPICEPSCVNNFEFVPTVKSENCDGCVVGGECHCEVQCAPNTKEWKAEGAAGACGKRDCLESTRDFGPPPQCYPETATLKQPPQRCEPPTGTRGRSYAITGCNQCYAGEDCKCEVGCGPGYKRVGGGAEGPKKCNSDTYKCPKAVKWHKSHKDGFGCYNKAHKEKVSEWCCWQAYLSRDQEPVPMQAPDKDCTTLDDKQECMKHQQTGKHGGYCCWRESGFGPGGPKCAAEDSKLITDEYFAEQCTNRPRVVEANFEEFPQCAPICTHNFMADDNVLVEGCSDCVAGEKDCKCTLSCREGMEYYGGGPLGHRSCDANGFGRPPICLPPKEPPRCRSLQNEAHARDTDCKCSAQEDATCNCQLNCMSGALRVGGGPEGPRKCVKKNTRLTKAIQCAGFHYEKDACLQAEQGGQPCCYGLQFEGTHLKKRCYAKGSPEWQSAPDTCAPLFYAEWSEQSPLCLPMCVNNFKNNPTLDASTSCDKCVLDAKNEANHPCECTVMCKVGLERVGGGPEGERACTETTAFPEGPVCTPIEKPPKCYAPLETPWVKFTGCEDCVAGEDCNCRMDCKPGYAAINHDDGPKKCLLVDNELYSHKKCKEFLVPRSRVLADAHDKNSCLNSADKKDHSPCCWKGWSSRGTDWSSAAHTRCLPKGSPDIHEAPNECAPVKKARWEDQPQCVPYCKNLFDKKDKSIVIQDCDNCVAGQPCDCQVSCAPGYERYGGGSEKEKRSCTSTSLSLGNPPLCLNKLPPPTCPRVHAPEWNVQGPCCDGSCDASDPNPLRRRCEVNCAAGYYPSTRVQGGTKECRVVSAREDLHSNQCKYQGSKNQCLQTAEHGSPCCWRSYGFSERVRCAKMGSAAIAYNTPPDECAKMEKAVWDPMPTCRPFCKDEFSKDKKLSVVGCKECIAGEHCDCKVTCADGYLRRQHRPKEGKKKCRAGPDGLPRFDEAPLCDLPCSPPEDQGMTLDVTQCQEPCFPDQDDCKCRVTCARGSVRVGGGREGPKFCTGVGDKTWYRDLPKCTPQCTQPSNQYGTLNTDDCQGTCDADDETCKCSLQCKVQDGHAGGGPQGKRVCKFFPGDTKKNRPAYALWVTADKWKWPSADFPNGLDSWDQPPMCMNPIWVTVVNAQNQKPLAGVTLTFIGQSDHDKVQTAVTEDVGKVNFWTMAETVTVKAEKEGYIEFTKTLIRQLHCTNPRNCGVQVALSKALGAGDVDPEDCSIIVNPATARWEMRAVLEWNAVPTDLDLWVRSWDCAHDVERRYHCETNRMDDNGIPQTDKNCMRTNFQADIVRYGEAARGCQMNRCRHVPEGGPGGATVFKDNGKPVCPKINENQFAKWVNWAVRMTSKLNMTRGWTNDHRIVLDVDKMTGYGPETVTFSNVPPGTYQIAVNQYSSGPPQDIKAGNPTVTIYMGANNVVFKCAINPLCPRESKLWNVLNVKVKVVEELPNGEVKFSIRLISKGNRLKPINTVGLPTRNSFMTITRTFWQDIGWSSGEEYFTPAILYDYSEQYLMNVCQGECRLAEGQDKRYEKCLADAHWP